MADDIRGMNPDQMRDTIAGFTTVKQVEDAVDKLTSVGFGRDGIMIARCLAKKAELGGKMTEEEKGLVAEAEAKVAHGKTLPPITGSLLLLPDLPTA